MSTENTQTFLWDKLILPVIILVLAFMGTWVFSINADVAVIKKSMTAVDTLVTDQRSADRMMILLEAQTKANTDLVNEMKTSQRELTDAVNEMKLALAKCCSKSDNFSLYGRGK